MPLLPHRPPSPHSPHSSPPLKDKDGSDCVRFGEPFILRIYDKDTMGGVKKRIQVG